MELDDVLGHHVVVGRPEALGQILAFTRIGERRVVVEERVPPDVDDLLGVPGDGNAPAQPCARERHVAQTTLDERERLVGAETGLDEVGTVGVELLEALLEGGELEEPVLLGLPDELDLVDRATVAGAHLLLGLEVGATRAVVALVGALVDEAVVVDELHEPADRGLVLGVGGADEEVIGDVDLRHQVAEALRVAVGELARRQSERFGRLRDRLAMLVGARQEEDVLAALALVPGEDVRGDAGVRMAEVRLGVDVVDRRGDVVRHERRRIDAAPERSGIATGGATPAAVLSPASGRGAGRRPMRFPPVRRSRPRCLA